MDFPNCQECGGQLLASNKYCPLCGTKNENAVERREDVNLVLAAQTYPGGSEALLTDGPCTPRKHINVVTSLKQNAVTSPEIRELLNYMNFCPDCGHKLDK